MNSSSSTAPICAQPTPTSVDSPLDTPTLGGGNTTTVLMPDQPGRQLIDVPKGLETLTQADVLLVKQKLQVNETLDGFSQLTKYNIENSVGQVLFKANEPVDSCCTSLICGRDRPFSLTLINGRGQEVMVIRKPFKTVFSTCQVFSPPGILAGSVVQKMNLMKSKFAVMNRFQKPVLWIEGPLSSNSSKEATSSEQKDFKFKVLSCDGLTQVGEICRNGTINGGGDDRNSSNGEGGDYGVGFPVDLEVRIKATLLGALFLIDFLFFDK